MTKLHTEPHNLNDKDRLFEGLSIAEQTELGDLTEVAQYLATSETPRAPDPSKLLSTLTPLLQGRVAKQSTFSLQNWLRLVHTQAALFEPAFWLASGLVFALGLILALLQENGLLILAFIYAAPVLTTAAVAYAFRPATRGLWELEQLSPVRPIELLYARLVLVLAINSIIALVLLCLIWANAPGVILWRLLIAWFGPMLGIASVALYLSLRCGAFIGLTAPILTWIGLVIASWQEITRAEQSTGDLIQIASRWFLSQVSTSNTILLASVILIVVSLLIFRWSGRFFLNNLLLREDSLWN
ncbi:MAG: hypothetical protein KF726_04580 [Anaerolineae bacterium]|nr:hypothetical protein [Anaerolineae bacterium]